MANNGNCDVCSGNQRNQTDMRRQKAMMYENRYTNNSMMPRMQMGCDSCGATRSMNSCDVCENVRVNNNCETCENTRVMNKFEDCGNSRRDELRGMPLAMGYVPWQNFGCTYQPMEGFHAGTIFPELDKPFYGRRGMR